MHRLPPKMYFPSADERAVIHKSSYSHPREDNCVECGVMSHGMVLGDTQNRDQGMFVLSGSTWASLAAAVKADAL